MTRNNEYPMPMLDLFDGKLLHRSSVSRGRQTSYGKQRQARLAHASANFRYQTYA
jgi:hypothetical protein